MRRALGLVLVVAVALIVAWRDGSLPGSGPRDHAATTAAGAIEALFRDRISDRWVEVEGRVSRQLADDRDGSRHQRFILALASGHTVLVAHNIDLAPRIPVSAGARVRVRGEYEWNPQGGVLHWTHRDPQGRHAGGWIEAGGRRFE